MQAKHPSCSVLHATPRVGIRLRVGRVGPKYPTMCQAGGVQRNCQLAAAALLSFAALQYTVPLDAAVCASATAVRSPSVGHTLAVKRALLEDLLMQEVGGRLKSMSDDDLVTVLEQIHQGRFQLPAAAPSLSNPQPSPDTLSGAAPPLTSTNSSSDHPPSQSVTNRQAASDLPDASSTAQDEWQSDKQAQPAASSPTGREGTDQQDAAAAQSLPDAWQQQTFRLQAFTKPLMQHLQGLASPQASPSGASNRLQDGGPIHQPTSEQQNRSIESQSSEPQSSERQSLQAPSSQLQSSQPQPSLPALAQQESGDREQRAEADLPAGSAFRHSGSAQDQSTQGRALPGQAVSSEELTSSEEDLQGQKEPLQSVEGSRGDDKESGKASSSSGMSSYVEQDAGSVASSRGQNVDEAEDTTTRMLESAGVLLPSSALNKSAVAGAISQPDRHASVREYLGVVWQRMQPQLGLLVVASTVSTLAATLAQLAATRSRKQAAAPLPSQPSRHQDQLFPQASGDNAHQVSGVQQRLAGVRQGLWQGLIARIGRNKSSGSEKAEPRQADAALGSSHVQADTLPEMSGGRHASGNGRPGRVMISGNGQNHARQEDEWGRPIVQIPAASENGVHQHRASNGGQSADNVPSKILWVRMDPEEPASSDGSQSSDIRTDPHTVLWQRDPAQHHAAEKADGLPRRFRRSRLGRHAVTVESLLDNVE